MNPIRDPNPIPCLYWGRASPFGCDWLPKFFWKNLYALAQIFWPCLGQNGNWQSLGVQKQLRWRKIWFQLVIVLVKFCLYDTYMYIKSYLSLKLIKNKEKHNNFKIVLIISAKLPCATCGGFSQIPSHVSFNTASGQYVLTSQPLLTLEVHGIEPYHFSGFFSKFLMGGTQNFWSPSVPDGDEVGWGPCEKNLTETKTAHLMQN